MNVFTKILQKDEIFETPRLRIFAARMNPKVFSDLFEIYSDNKNVKDFARIVFKDVDDFFHFLTQKIEVHQNELNGYIGYLIVHKVDDKIIGVRNLILDGVYNFQGLRQDNNENVISEIVINKNYWNKCFAEEASIAIFNHIKRYGIKNIATFINPENFAAINLNKKLGFELTNPKELIEKSKFNKDIEILCPDLKSYLVFEKKLYSKSLLSKLFS